MVQLQSANHAYSVIGLAETNIDPSESPVFQLDNYNSFYQNVNLNKNKGILQSETMSS